MSKRAKKRAQALAYDADLRIRTPKGFFERDPKREATGRSVAADDARLPLAGTLLTREYQSVTFVVKVPPDGFEHGCQNRSRKRRS